jgi:hypothetical protein
MPRRGWRAGGSFAHALGRRGRIISKAAQAEIKAALAGKANATVYSYTGQRHAFSRHNGSGGPRQQADKRISKSTSAVNFGHVWRSRHAGYEHLIAQRTGVKGWEWECDMTQTKIPASVKSQTIAVEHIRISSARSFAEVRRKLEGTVPKLDTGIAEALRSGNQKRAKDPAGTPPAETRLGGMSRPP